MQTFKSVLSQNIRRATLALGFVIFVTFAFKASHDVSNSKIAAGVELKQSNIIKDQNNPTTFGNNSSPALFVSGVSPIQATSKDVSANKSVQTTSSQKKSYNPETDSKATLEKSKDIINLASKIGNSANKRESD